MEIVISKSDKKNKKYDAVINGTKTISFGQKGASDYTKHKDKDRKERYIDRHSKNENWGATGVKKMLAFIIKILYGISQQYKQVLLI